MKTITLNVEKEYSCDVLVCGGGVSGFAAAVSAARNGAETMLIESRMSSRAQFDVTEGYQPSHALFYLKKGSFVVEIEGKSEEIVPGDCFILPDYVHFRRNVLNPIEFVYVKFAYNSACPYSFDMPYGKVNFRDKNRFEFSISALEKLIGADEPMWAGYREHLLMDILFQIHFEQNLYGESAQERPSHDSLVKAAVEYIEQNIGGKILIAEICRAVGTNPSTLNFKFRREFGMSIGEFVTSRRMNKAAHLLVSSTYSLSEIALRCGFDHVYYFSTAFTKFTGVPPSADRR